MFTWDSSQEQLDMSEVSLCKVKFEYSQYGPSSTESLAPLRTKWERLWEDGIREWERSNVARMSWMSLHLLNMASRSRTNEYIFSSSWLRVCAKVE